MPKGIFNALTLAAATAMITVGLSAGEPGKVKLSNTVYRVGEGQATVTVTDGTGGYKAGAGVGFNRVTAGFSGAGVHPITISDEPSEALNDSGVIVVFPAPAAGEEALSVTDHCTVVKFQIVIVVVPEIKIVGHRTIFMAKTSITGVALPASSQRVSLHVDMGEDTNDWVPPEATRTVPSGEIDTRIIFRLKRSAVNPAATKFKVEGSYLGLKADDSSELGGIGGP